MRSVLALVLLLAACPAPTSRPKTAQRTSSDGTCAEVAWSCVGTNADGAAWGCTEGDASQTAQHQATCTQDKGGLFALNACLRDNVVGGCTLARGSACTTTWFHAPLTLEQVAAECAKQGAVFATP